MQKQNTAQKLRSALGCDTPKVQEPSGSAEKRKASTNKYGPRKPGKKRSGETS